LRTNIDPGLPVRTALTGPLALQGLVLGALLLASLALLRRRPWAALGGAWVFLHLSPTNRRYLAAKAGHGAHTLQLPPTGGAG